MQLYGRRAEGAGVEFWEGVLLPNGEGSGERAMSSPRNFFYFQAQNGEIRCILGAIFTVRLPELQSTAVLSTKCASI